MRLRERQRIRSIEPMESDVGEEVLGLLEGVQSLYEGRCGSKLRMNKCRATIHLSC